MIPKNPIAGLPTHEVINTPPHLGDQDLWGDDAPLQEWAASQGAGGLRDRLAISGKRFGAAEVFEKADQANRFPPQLKAFDRYGMRVNQVEYHPAYHDLMALAIENEVPSFAWRNEVPGAQVGHAALTYMFNQVEGGVMCPMAMVYSAIPSLKTTPAIADEWMPRLLSTSYDPRDIPVTEKSGATIGMFMTENRAARMCVPTPRARCLLARTRASARNTCSPVTSFSAPRRCAMRFSHWLIPKAACPAFCCRAGSRTIHVTGSIFSG